MQAIDAAALIQEGYNCIPVVRRLIADDLTPVSALSRFADEPYSFLFESVVGGESLARYSILGIKPVERLVGDLNSVQVIDAEGQSRSLAGDPYNAVRSYLAQIKRPQLAGLPRFCGGLVGYFSYDVVRLLEHLPDMPEDILGMPDIQLMRFDTVLVFDHSFNQLLLVTHMHIDNVEALPDGEAAAQAELDRVEAQLRQPVAPRLVKDLPEPQIKFESFTSQADYQAAVNAGKEYIKAGDIFQFVPSLRLAMDTKASPLQIYRSMRSLNPSPYMFCMRLGDFSWVGASPEIMVRVEDGLVHVRPIAGTIGRGSTEQEDESLAAELLADPKERAEHVMLIDLGRNDVGRVSKAGTVELKEQMVIERYSHVQHIVSHVQGELREDMDALDALRHCHPAGTVSGAPKIRAMEIIDEVEPIKRGPYAGAVGYVDFNGNMDTCIALRTCIIKDGKAYVQAGAGVVADSIPEKEYQECMKKAQAVLQSVARAEHF